MQIQIESTSQMTDFDGVPVRVWKGTTAAGVECFVFVHRLAVHKDFDAAEFDRELKEMDPPGGPRIIPLSAIL